MAITNGHLDLAKYLLDHGADPNLATDAGLTALYADHRRAVGAARLVPAAHHRAGKDHAISI